MRYINFSSTPATGDKKELIQEGIAVAKMAMNKYYGANFLTTNFSVSGNYEEKNEKFVAALRKFSAKAANFSEDEMDFSDPSNLVEAFEDARFEKTYFSIERQVLNALNADNEVEDALMLANVYTVGLGNSKTFEIEPKSLFKVQDGSYGNNVSLYQKEFNDSITLTPSPKDVAVAIDVVQMSAYNYDWGKQIAKVAMSFRTKMYVDIVNEIYTITNVSSTPFYSATFAKVTYGDLYQRTKAANGNVPTYAIGTHTSFVNMSDGVTSGFATQDEINKTGFIGNLYGIPSMVINQAVDSNVATYDFQVPNDRVLMLSMTEKPVKLVKEGNIRVREEDGRNDSLYVKTYKYTDSWTVGLATQANYAIQAV